jgi:hypothetical protein
MRNTLMRTRCQTTLLLMVSFTHVIVLGTNCGGCKVLEVHDINGRLTTRNVWYTTDDYGTLWRFVVTEGGVRYWGDAIRETANMKFLGYTQWSQHVHVPMPVQHSGYLKNKEKSNA